MALLCMEIQCHKDDINFSQKQDLVVPGLMHLRISYSCGTHFYELLTLDFASGSLCSQT